MIYNRAILLLIPAISAIFFIIDNNIAFADSPQSRSQIVECTDGSCYRLSCTDGQPCQTFPSNQPSFLQPSQEVTTTTVQPPEKTPTMRSADQATTVTKPNDATTTYQVVEVPVEVCGDGLDNDDDSEVDEDCRATTFSPTTPTVLLDEDRRRQLSIDGLEQPNEENGNSDDESNGDSAEKENEDED